MNYIKQEIQTILPKQQTIYSYKNEQHMFQSSVVLSSQSNLSICISFNIKQGNVVNYKTIGVLDYTFQNPSIHSLLVRKCMEINADLNHGIFSLNQEGQLQCITKSIPKCNALCLKKHISLVLKIDIDTISKTMEKYHINLIKFDKFKIDMAPITNIAEIPEKKSNIEQIKILGAIRYIKLLSSSQQTSVHLATFLIEKASVIITKDLIVKSVKNKQTIKDLKNIQNYNKHMANYYYVPDNHDVLFQEPYIHKLFSKLYVDFPTKIKYMLQITKAVKLLHNDGYMFDNLEKDGVFIDADDNVRIINKITNVIITKSPMSVITLGHIMQTLFVDHEIFADLIKKCKDMDGQLSFEQIEEFLINIKNFVTNDQIA